jgi:hypothetical protein
MPDPFSVFCQTISRTVGYLDVLEGLTQGLHRIVNPLNNLLGLEILPVIACVLKAGVPHEIRG